MRTMFTLSAISKSIASLPVVFSLIPYVVGSFDATSCSDTTMVDITASYGLDCSLSLASVTFAYSSWTFGGVLPYTKSFQVR